MELLSEKIKNVPVVPPALITLLSTQSFTGNIRELQTIIFDALARHQKGILSVRSFRDIIGNIPLPLEKVPPVHR